MALLAAALLAAVAAGRAAAAHTYCSVPDSGMQGHQWDHEPGASGDCVPGADYGTCHHWSTQKDAIADCNAWADCAGYYMHPDKTDYYCMPRHPGPNTTWPPPGQPGSDSAGCEAATGGVAYIRDDAVCGAEGNGAFLGCHCACPACVPPSTKKCTAFATSDPSRNCSCDSPAPAPPPPPPPPLSTNPCIRFGHTIPVANHVDVVISQGATTHTWTDFKFSDFSDWVNVSPSPPHLAAATLPMVLAWVCRCSSRGVGRSRCTRTQTASAAPFSTPSRASRSPQGALSSPPHWRPIVQQIPPPR